MPVESEGQFMGVSFGLTIDPGDTGTSLQGWQMKDNDYSRFDPTRSYTQNYGDGKSNNDGFSDGASTVYAEGNRGK